MNHWAFVAAAYLVTLTGTAGLLLGAWRSMRTGEAEADKLRDRR